VWHINVLRRAGEACANHGSRDAVRSKVEVQRHPRGGDDCVKRTSFNCHAQYDELANMLFDKIRIMAIRIGYNCTEAWRDCN
jgi:hypothetical protein